MMTSVKAVEGSASLRPYTVIRVNKLSVARIVSSVFHTLRPHPTPHIFVVVSFLTKYSKLCFPRENDTLNNIKRRRLIQEE